MADSLESCGPEACRIFGMFRSLLCPSLYNFTLLCDCLDRLRDLFIRFPIHFPDEILGTLLVLVGQNKELRLYDAASRLPVSAWQSILEYDPGIDDVPDDDEDDVDEEMLDYEEDELREDEDDARDYFATRTDWEASDYEFTD